MTDQDFQERASEAIEDLEEKILSVADRYGFEVESAGGLLTLLFDDPTPAKFLISPNGPARQIWVSALSTSFKFGWDEDQRTFVLDKTGEPLVIVISQVLSKQLASDITL